MVCEFGSDGARCKLRQTIREAKAKLHDWRELHTRKLDAAQLAGSAATTERPNSAATSINNDKKEKHKKIVTGDAHLTRSDIKLALSPHLNPSGNPGYKSRCDQIDTKPFAVGLETRCVDSNDACPRRPPRASQRASIRVQHSYKGVRHAQAPRRGCNAENSRRYSGVR